MNEVVESIHKSELVGRQWLLPDAVMDIFDIYLFCCDQSAATKTYQRCVEIKEQNKNPTSSVRLANNLPFIENLLKAPYEKNSLVVLFVF